MAEILFFSFKTRFKLNEQKKASRWLEAVAKKEKKELESLHYIFCSDPYLFELNKKYLHHPLLTDILSFDFSTGKKINGEIFISIPRVRENALIFKQPFNRELKRVMCHGLLHFMGYRDKTKSEKALMRDKEEASLSLWK